MLSHFKRRVGVITAVAVMAALVPVLAASPASAAASATLQVKGDTTNLSACPTSASIPSAGFSDTTSTAVDCIKYYGITTGVTATTYEPTGSVPRWQMALFLTRMATAMGVTLGSGADQGFTDISGKSAAIQTAVNQIKQLGVTTGTTATTFSPDSNVTREQMAMFLERLAAQTAPGAGGNSDGPLATIDGAAANVTLYNYADIDSGVTYEGHNAIVELYHLGVTDDVSGATAYRPAADMTRDEMATFMTNLLAHSNARPAGLVIQSSHSAIVGAAASTQQVQVSHRATAGSTGTEGTLVDLMAYKTNASTSADSVAFAATGVCSGAVAAYQGSTACTIDNSDSATNSAGNILITLDTMTVTLAEGDTVQYWAWTSPTATVFLNGTYTTSSTTVAATAGGDFVYWTLGSHPYAQESSIDNDASGAEETSRGRMGTTHTINMQLKSAAGVSALLNVAQAGCRIAVQVRTGTSGSASGTISNTYVTTDANGAATYSFSSPTAEPTAGDDNDAADYHTILVLSNPAPTGTNTLLGCTEIGNFRTGALGTDTDARHSTIWQDTARAATLLTSAVGNPYVTASGLTAGANNTVTGTLWDQYGVGIAATSLGLTSAIDLATVSTFSVTRTTNSSGTATFGVNRVAATTGKETFRVNTASDALNSSAAAYWVNAPDSTVLDTGNTASAPNNFSAGSNAYDASAADGQPEGAFVARDLANNVLIAHLCGDNVGCKYVKYTYDSNDSFVIAAEAKTMVEWETAWAAIAAATNGILTAADDMGTAGEAQVATTSYASQWNWAG